MATNPAIGGTAAIDAAATRPVTWVGLQAAPSRGRDRMSRVCRPWSTIPTTMNRVALNRAWATSRAQPATVASGRPMPTSTVMNPSWLMVPKASNCFRSHGRRALRPPAIMVTRPTVTTSGRHTGTDAKAGARRAIR